MDIPLQITFRNMEPSDAVEARTREKAANLWKVNITPSQNKKKPAQIMYWFGEFDVE